MDPFSDRPWFSALGSISLEPGERVIEFSSSSLSGSGTLEHECVPHGLTYAMIDPPADGDHFVDWKVEVSQIMPPVFARLPLVLLQGGRWLVAPEPDVRAGSGVAGGAR
jgi:hypothetical protein